MSPIIKWAGGKSRLLEQLLPMLPAGAQSMRHVEPFIGGAAMFFDRLPRRALLCDVNPALINLYSCVRDQVEDVIAELQVLALAHAGDGLRTFERTRTRYNHSQLLKPAQRAAAFIYLNKTCFNGLHRLNGRGEFNVPFGGYKNPGIVAAHHLRCASAALKRADLKLGSFEHLLESAEPGDFVYLDPPYDPVSDTASFTTYAQDGFGRREQATLRDVFNELHARGCKLMLSNSDTPFIRSLYSAYSISTVLAPRSISGAGKTRFDVKEVVVRNY